MSNEETGQWQPIETAPKDGTRIITYTSERCENCSPSSAGMLIAWWNDHFWCCGMLPKNVPLFVHHTPTHWAPLLEPPAKQRA